MGIRRWASAYATLLLSLLIVGCGSNPGLSQGSSQTPSDHEFVGQHAPFISARDLVPAFERNPRDYVLVDARGKEERAQRHVDGDVWLPLADAERDGGTALEGIGHERLIVLYCECPNAEASALSVILEQHGFSDQQLRVLEEGLAGWVANGGPVVSEADPCQARRWPVACQG